MVVISSVVKSFLRNVESKGAGRRPPGRAVRGRASAFVPSLPAVSAVPQPPVRTASSFFFFFRSEAPWALHEELHFLAAHSPAPREDRFWSSSPSRSIALGRVPKNFQLEIRRPVLKRCHSDLCGSCVIWDKSNGNSLPRADRAGPVPGTLHIIAD